MSAICQQIHQIRGFRAPKLYPPQNRHIGFSGLAHCVDFVNIAYCSLYYCIFSCFRVYEPYFYAVSGSVYPGLLVPGVPGVPGVVMSRDVIALSTRGTFDVVSVVVYSGSIQ